MKNAIQGIGLGTVILAALKQDRNDFHEVFDVMQGEDIAKSREENPCELETVSVIRIVTQRVWQG